jgi:hypothetical protein
MWIGCVALALAGCKEVKPERATSARDGIGALINVTQVKTQTKTADVEGTPPEIPTSKAPAAPAPPKQKEKLP